MPRSGEFGQKIQKLARAIGGDTTGELVLERASAVAQAKLELDRIHRAKIEMIKRVYAQGSVDMPPKIFSEIREVDGSIIATALPGIRIPDSLRLYPKLPKQEPDRTAEAIRRALPELMKLHRYERRAALRLDRAMRELMRAKSGVF
jgi:hypothetical protein